MRKTLCTAFIAVVLLPLPGCPAAVTVTGQTIAVAGHFVNALSLLKEATALYKTYVSDSVQEAKNEIAKSENENVKIDLSVVATRWETKWKKVDAQTKELEAKFNDVDEAATKYWETLNRVTTAIKDKELRNREIQRNKEARKKWDEAHESAVKQIDRAKALRDKGGDFHNVMIAAALRSQIAEYTATLDSIADEASRLLTELESVAEKGKSIVSAE